MKPVDFIIIAVILLIAAGAVIALVKAKKSGKKCIGCPEGSNCGGSCSCCNK